MDVTPQPPAAPAAPKWAGCLFPGSVLMVAAAVLAHGLIPHPQPKPTPPPAPVIVHPEPQAAPEWPQPFRVVVEGMPAPAPAPVPAPVKPDVTEPPAPSPPPTPVSDPPLVAAYRTLRAAQPAAFRTIAGQIRSGQIKTKVDLESAVKAIANDWERAFDLAFEESSDTPGQITKPATLADLFNKMAGVK